MFTAIEHGPLASGRRPQPPASQTATLLLASSPGAGCLCCSEGPSRGHPQDTPRSLLPSLDDHSASPTVFTAPDSPAGGSVRGGLGAAENSQARPGPPKAPKALCDPAHPSPYSTQGPAARLHLWGRVLSPRYLRIQACSLSTLLPRAPGWAWPPDPQALCC